MLTSLLFALDGREDLAKSIIEYANKWSEDNQTELGQLRHQKFSDTELCVDYIDSVRGKRVYLLTSPNTSDKILQLLLAIDAAKRAGAKEIIPILPYYPYARSDKKDQSRGPIGAKIMAEIIEQRGATSIITFDLHADQIQGFFNIPVTHIEGKNVFDSYINEHLSRVYDITLAGPDAGSAKKVKRMKDQLIKQYSLNYQYIMIDKTRTKANVVDEMIVIGDKDLILGKDILILDDMTDTAGTLIKAADVLINAGANSVRAIVSHAILSGNALDNLGESKLSELIISDSLELEQPIKLGGFMDGINDEAIMGFNKIRVVSLADQIGLAIAANNNSMSYEMLKTNK